MSRISEQQNSYACETAMRTHQAKPYRGRRHAGLTPLALVILTSVATGCAQPQRGESLAQEPRQEQVGASFGVPNLQQFPSGWKSTSTVSLDGLCRAANDAISREGLLVASFETPDMALVQFVRFGNHSANTGTSARVVRRLLETCHRFSERLVDPEQVLPSGRVVPELTFDISWSATPVSLGPSVTAEVSPYEIRRFSFSSNGTSTTFITLAAVVDGGTDGIWLVTASNPHQPADNPRGSGQSAYLAALVVQAIHVASGGQ